MIVLIDNYDSFVYNLARYVAELGYQTKVVRHDALSLAELEALAPSHFIISPGPCTPKEAGISLDLVKHFGSRLPILGVCLGHQVIAEAYGAKVQRAKHPKHGKLSYIDHQQQALFEGLPTPLAVGRYHSLIVSEEAFPTDLEVTARCEAGEVMALRHRHHAVFGVQFHPESILTQGGHLLLKNFLVLGGREASTNHSQC